MKICKNCGAQNWDICSTCERCKSILLDIDVPIVEYQEEEHQGTQDFWKKTPRALFYNNTSVTTAAKVFMIIATVGQALLTLLTFIMWIIFACLASRDDASLESGIVLALFFSCLAVFFIGLTVSLIMTIVYYRKTANSKERVGMGFKICTLLFVNFIAGILMLADERDKGQYI